MDRLEFRVLGPIEIDRGGVAQNLGARRQRVVLAALLIRANQVVAAERLVDDLWGPTPPDGARHRLQVHVANLRKVLEPGTSADSARVLMTRPGGYSLRVEDRDLDAARFEWLVARGRHLARDGHPRDGASALREALALWRGDAFADVADEQFAESEAARLNEARLAATEDWLDAELALGHHAELVGEIDRLARSYPFREKLWAQLIVALYRSGRQAEALHASQELRQVLRDELGVEPSRELRDLEAHVLDQSPDLDAPVGDRRPDRSAQTTVLDDARANLPVSVDRFVGRRDLNAIRRTDDRPPIRYAKAGEISIAYRVLGVGPLDLVWVPGLSSNIEAEWDDPFQFQLFWRRLASFSRLITFDKRGMGLSDRDVGTPTLEERMDDVRAVMDALGSEQAALIGQSEGGPMSLLFAATYPERTIALVLYATLARVRRDVDYPYGCEEARAELYRILDDEWGTGAGMRVFAQTVMADAGTREHAGRIERASGSPGTIRALLDTLAGIDVRDVLPMISVPTLVLHGTDDAAIPIANGRWLADHITDARFVELPGDHSTARFNDQFAVEIEKFLTGRRHAIATDRILSTVLFSDIVGSTNQAAALGDRRWREVLDRHDAIVRREIDTYRGKLIRSTGDGVLATFDGPARAVACGCDLRDDLRSLGIDVRVGLHTGEIELRGEEIGGIAVHIGARVAAIGEAGEVLVSRTVTDLVAGSGLEFTNRGTHHLKGVPGDWQLFAVTSA